MAEQRGGVVAAGHQVTAQAAAQALRAGGNAFDAAVAGVLAACVAESVLASLGGGGFLMAYDARAETVTLYDFFAQTPQRQTPQDGLEFYAIEADFGPARQQFHIGAGATAVPGMVPGLFAVHGDLCRLPFGELARPAVEAAREGVEMTPFQAYLFSVVAPILTASEQARALHAPQGHLLRVGERYRNQDFADLLERLSTEGAALFSSGAVAAAMVHESAAYGGHLTAADLTDYRVYRRKPLVVEIAGARIFLNPPPSAGGPLIGFGLHLLECLQRQEGEQAVDAIHTAAVIHPLQMARVMAETNAAREAGRDLLAEDVLRQHCEALVRTRRPVATRGTTHISVVDAQGNAAAVTVSNGEGNGRLVDGFGFMLNNMLGEEDLHPEGLMSWPKNVRLASMMAPLLLREACGQITALGSGGSNRIRTALLQVLAHLLLQDKSLSAAIEAPRLHVEKTGRLSVEAERGLADAFDEATLQELAAAFTDFHAWEERNLFFGGVHAARRGAGGALSGAGDPRRRGVAVVVA